MTANGADKPTAEPVPVAQDWLRQLGALVSAALNRDLSADEHRQQVNDAHAKLYATIVATEASLAACRALVPKWRAEDVHDGQRTSFRSATTCADELDAAIDAARAVLPLAGEVAHG